MDESTRDIPRVLAKANRLDLRLCAYILSMALMEAVEIADGRHQASEPPRS